MRPDPPYTVSGVAENVKNGGLAAGEEPEYYRLRRNRAEDWDREGIVLLKSNLPWTLSDSDGAVSPTGLL